MGRGMLRTHVDDHRLVLAELDVDVARVKHRSLRQAQGRALLYGERDRGGPFALAQLLETFGSLRLELLAGQRGPGACLNCTGTRPTE